MSPELTAILLRGRETKDFDYKAAIQSDESDKSAYCAIGLHRRVQQRTSDTVRLKLQGAQHARLGCTGAPGIHVGAALDPLFDQLGILPMSCHRERVFLHARALRQQILQCRQIVSGVAHTRSVVCRQKSIRIAQAA
jgi:hypothetical protein